jgi:hypothetical protein
MPEEANNSITPRQYVPVLLCLFIMMMLSFSPVFSQDRQKSFRIERTAEPPKIDGFIEDPCWKNIQPVSGFIQHDPVNGAKASEETYVWMAYDSKNLYFAFLMEDSQPDKIWAELTPRNDFEDNDSITVILDTYNDKRTSIQFTVNPRGVQKNSVETIWKSDAIIREDGWSAEMAIPFKSLRFSSKEYQVWGINFERYIFRLNEEDYWTHVERDIPRLHQMGELTGLSGVRPSYNLEFFPYFGYRSTKWDSEEDSKMAYGLDFKYGILPNLILDMTVSPDFSEVESDPFIYQLSPYENYLRENRPFFSEGSRYFNLSTEHGWRGRNRMFYSRRISNPVLATKLSGKTDGYAFGILGAINDEEDVDDHSHYGVVRIQKDVFKNSQIGIFYSGRELSGEYDHNFAVDYNFNFKDIYYIRGSSAFFFTNDSSVRNNGMHIFQFEREPDAGLQLNLTFSRIEENFAAEAGFVTRTNTQNIDMGFGYSWRYNQGKIQRMEFSLGGNLNQDSHGNRTGQSLDLFGRLNFFSRMFLRWRLEAGESKYQVYDENDELFWTENYIDKYGGDISIHWYRGGFLKDINLEADWQRRGIYNEDYTGVESGTQTSVEGSLIFRPASNFEFSVGGDWIRQVIQQTGETVFDGLTYEVSLHYQLTRYLFLTSRLKGETREDQYNFDFLIGYYFGAGNIIQLSYKKSERTEDFIREGGRSYTLKLSYLLRL